MECEIHREANRESGEAARARNGEILPISASVSLSLFQRLTDTNRMKE